MSDDLITRLGAIKLPTIAKRRTRNEAMERIVALEAENARLREAFKEILEHELDGMLDPQWAHNIARAALGDDA